MSVHGIFIDIETTGLDFTQHRAIEIACKSVDLFEGTVRGAYHSIIQQPEKVWAQADLISLGVNGFKWEDLFQGKPENQVAEELTHCFAEWGVRRGDAVFIAQNPTFDRVFFAQLIPVYKQDQLQWPYHWLDFASMYWALQVHGAVHGKHLSEINLSKDTIAKQYGLDAEPHPHRAMNGVDHLIRCYAQVVGWLSGVGSK